MKPVGLPEHPADEAVKEALGQITSQFQIDYICCPHSGENLPGKWRIGDCETICLGSHYLVLCPACWQIVRANAYDSIVQIAVRVNKNLV